MNASDDKTKELKEALGDLENPSLSHLIISLSSSAIVHMGLEPSMKDQKDLKIAQFNIALLEVLKKKTENNRTEQESSLLDSYIKDLKMSFIEVKKITSK